MSCWISDGTMARADDAMGMAKAAVAHRQKLHTSKRARHKFFFIELLDKESSQNERCQT